MQNKSKTNKGLRIVLTLLILAGGFYIYNHKTSQGFASQSSQNANAVEENSSIAQAKEKTSTTCEVPYIEEKKQNEKDAKLASNVNSDVSTESEVATEVKTTSNDIGSPCNEPRNNTVDANENATPCEKPCISDCEKNAMTMPCNNHENSGKRVRKNFRRHNPFYNGEKSPCPNQDQRDANSAPDQNGGTPPSDDTTPTTPSTGQMEEFLSLINAERAKNGLTAMKLNSELNAAAYAKSKHMADNNYFAHTAPDGTDDFYFIEQANYNYQIAGVNIARGYFDGNAGVVSAWMSSSGHRANILMNGAEDLGIGVCGEYFTMMIGSEM